MVLVFVAIILFVGYKLIEGEPGH
jgi:hypothetical protein